MLDIRNRCYTTRVKGQRKFATDKPQTWRTTWQTSNDHDWWQGTHCLSNTAVAVVHMILLCVPWGHHKAMHHSTGFVLSESIKVLKLLPTVSIGICHSYTFHTSAIFCPHAIINLNCFIDNYALLIRLKRFSTPRYPLLILLMLWCTSYIWLMEVQVNIHIHWLVLYLRK